ncbi:MAG: 50S ribosomal protein L11 methyltransferase [Clostridia bacterium]|nr:50S ribosomal protein L11 methyltransferase [Clostridia bacterium]
MSGTYVEVDLPVPVQAADVVAWVLVSHGSGGVVFPTEDRLVAYFPAEEWEGLRPRLLEALSAVARRLPGLEPVRMAERIVRETAWAEAWKAFFRPVRVGRVVVAPTWEEVRVDVDQVVVRIDPGMAFGTGGHASTAVSLEALQDEVVAGSRWLDLGTGSGVLAVAAARLGASVAAVDVDPVAVAAARRNAEANGVAASVTVLGGDACAPDFLAELARAHGPFDGAVANISLELAVRLAPVVAPHLRRGGAYVAAGFLAADAEVVAAAVVRAGLMPARRLVREDWAAVVARRAG